MYSFVTYTDCCALHILPIQCWVWWFKRLPTNLQWKKCFWNNSQLLAWTHILTGVSHCVTCAWNLCWNTLLRWFPLLVYWDGVGSLYHGHSQIHQDLSSHGWSNTFCSVWSCATVERVLRKLWLTQRDASSLIKENAKSVWVHQTSYLCTAAFGSCWGWLKQSWKHLSCCPLITQVWRRQSSHAPIVLFLPHYSWLQSCKPKMRCLILLNVCVGRNQSIIPINQE